MIITDMNDSNLRILSQCNNGKVFKCQSCDKIHIEYKNFYFSFDDEEYEFFKKFFIQFNNNRLDNFTKNEHCQRRFKVSVGHPNLVALFNHSEIDELKVLLKGYSKQAETFKLITSRSINKQFSDN